MRLQEKSTIFLSILRSEILEQLGKELGMTLAEAVRKSNISTSAILTILREIPER